MLRTAITTGLAAFAAADINADHSALLFGKNEASMKDGVAVWEQFVKEFDGVSPVDLSLESAKSNFFAQLESIIEHNSKGDRKFDRGLNAFSAMSFEQFREHYHLNKNHLSAAQNCAVT